ncbi:hypothetical protein MMC12_004347 [Toensbergia leucococca]|nr:hypothetical protein [Toensbergia leucococca]
MSLSASFDYAILDVFTESRWTGNPLAIVNIPTRLILDQDQKQKIACEFNFSETVFLHEAEGGFSSHRRIEIFTPTEELPFAGHPTIGTICYICADAPIQDVTLLTKAGPIAARYDRSTRIASAQIPHDICLHSKRLGWMQVLESQPQLIETRGSVEKPLHETWSWARESEGMLPVVSIVKGLSFILVELPTVKDHLEKIQPSYRRIDPETIQLDDGWSPSFVAPYYYVVGPDEGDQITRIRARLIEPDIGEDPATGSAASTLGSYLALKENGDGKTYRYRIEQGVEMGRRSIITVDVTMNETGKSVNEVMLSGASVMAMQGTLTT